MSVKVSIVDPERMNIAGLLLAAFLREQIKQPKFVQKAQCIHGVFGFQIGLMAFNARFESNSIIIQNGTTPKTRACITGSFEETLSFFAGSRSTISTIIAAIEGRITIRGNPFAALQLLSLFTKHSGLSASRSTHTSPTSTITSSQSTVTVA